MPFHALTLSNRHLRLDVLPAVGCSWRSVQLKRGRRSIELLHPFPDLPGLRAAHVRVGGFLMGPWCNRIAGAAFAHRKKRYALRSNLEDGSAIHGDLFSRPWRVRWSDATGLESELDARGFPDFNFPLPLRFRHRVMLVNREIRCTLFVKNLGAFSLPVGLGFHPFFRRTIGGATASLQLPASRAYDGGPLPKFRSLPVSSALDFRIERPLSDTFVDRCFTGIKGATRLRWRGQVEAILRGGPSLTHAYVYAPRTHGRHRADFVCVEPMTHAANAFHAFPDTLRTLKPGEEWGSAWTLELRPLRR